MSHDVMLQNVAAHNVGVSNVNFSKPKRHITYSVTKRITLQNFIAHIT
jgi:hypothetical protein